MDAGDRRAAAHSAARVVVQEERGYGGALVAGFARRGALHPDDGCGPVASGRVRQGAVGGAGSRRGRHRVAVRAGRRAPRCRSVATCSARCSTACSAAGLSLQVRDMSSGFRLYHAPRRARTRLRRARLRHRPGNPRPRVRGGVARRRGAVPLSAAAARELPRAGPRSSASPTCGRSARCGGCATSIRLRRLRCARLRQRHSAAALLAAAAVPPRHGVGAAAGAGARRGLRLEPDRRRAAGGQRRAWTSGSTSCATRGGTACRSSQASGVRSCRSATARSRAWCARR